MIWFACYVIVQIVEQRAMLDKYIILDEDYKHLKSRNDFLEEKCSSLERQVQQWSGQIVTETTILTEHVTVTYKT